MVGDGETGDAEDGGSFDELLRTVASMPLVEPAERLPKKIGRYELRAVLGAGSSAIVYRALDEILKREVALKVVRAPEHMTAFVEEARRAASLRHRHVVSVHDVAPLEDRMAIVMELAEGGTLRERLDSRAFSVSDALRLGIELFDALAASHAAGLVHRDVKPSNVLLDSAGSVLLGDFGIAIEGEQVGIIAGTRAYMAPEQARGQQTDARSDVYAGALVWLEALLGTRDRGAPSLSLRGLAARAGPLLAFPIARLLRRALHADPALRPSASEVRDAVRSFSRARAVALPFAVLVALVIAGVSAFAVLSDDRPLRLGNALRLTDTGIDEVVFDLDVSPDGSRVVYLLAGGRVRVGALRRDLAPRDVREIDVGGSVHAVRFSGADELVVSRETTVVRVRNLSSPEIAPVASGRASDVAGATDGAIAFIDETGLHLAQAGDGPRLVTRTPAGRGLGALQFSPDERWLLFAFETEGPTLVRAIRRDGTGEHTVLEAPHLVQSDTRVALAWIGDRVVYGRAETPPAQIGTSLWELPMDASTATPSGAARRIQSPIGQNISTLRGARDGRSIAMLRYEIQHRSYVATVERDGPPRLGPIVPIAERSAFRASGWDGVGHVLGMSIDALRGYVATRIDVQTGAAEHIDSVDSSTYPVAAHDGALWWFRFEADDALVRPSLIRLGASGLGTPVTSIVPRTPGAFAPPPDWARIHCPSAPGSDCVLGELVDGTLTWSSIAPDGTRTTRAVEERATRWDQLGWSLSPRGRLARVRGRAHRVDLEGTSVSLEGADVIRTAFLDESHLLAIVRRASGYTLVHVDLETAVQSDLWAPAREFPVYVTANSTGTRVAITTATIDSDAWIAELSGED